MKNVSFKNVNCLVSTPPLTMTWSVSYSLLWKLRFLKCLPMFVFCICDLIEIIYAKISW